MEIITIILCTITAIASLVVYRLRKTLNYWKRLNIPHDEPHILLGNLQGFRTKYQLGEIFANYYRKFKGTGPFAGFFVGQRPAVLLLEMETIKHILIKDFTNFTDKGLYYNEKSDPLTGHLFLVDGEKWRSLRNKLSPTFTSGKMKSMYPILLDTTSTLMNVLSEQIKVNSVVDVRDLLGRFTTDIIASVAFGIECNSLRHSNKEFLEMGRKTIEKPRHNSIVTTFIDSYPRLARKLGMRILRNDVHEFFMKTITENVKYREKHNIKRNDFLNILIELKNNKNDKSGLGGLTLEEVAAQVFVFYLGGFETSSSTMSYALYELAQNHDIQDRLREEINEVFEQFDGEEITYEDILKITYLDQVFTETLRKYPVVSALNRQALNDYVVAGYPKYVIKKGTPVFIPVLGIHHDPEFYPNPKQFDPERFSPEMVKERDSVEFLSFGDGPRNCIGKRFGQMQSRLGLAYLIRKFRFTVCSKTDIPMTFDPNSQGLTPKNLLYLNVEAI